MSFFRGTRITPGWSPPAGWYPDPTGQHELRYWGGHEWTHFVANDGSVSEHWMTGAPRRTAETPRSTTSMRSARTDEEPLPDEAEIGWATPSWHPDPTGDHELRYWDGSQWTDAVMDDGRPSTAGWDPSPWGPRLVQDDGTAPRTFPVRAIGNTALGIVGRLLVIAAVIALIATPWICLKVRGTTPPYDGRDDVLFVVGILGILIEVCLGLFAIVAGALWALGEVKRFVLFGAVTGVMAAVDAGIWITSRVQQAINENITVHAIVDVNIDGTLVEQAQVVDVEVAPSRDGSRSVTALHLRTSPQAPIRRVTMGQIRALRIVG